MRETYRRAETLYTLYVKKSSLACGRTSCTPCNPCRHTLGSLLGSSAPPSYMGTYIRRLDRPSRLRNRRTSMACRRPSHVGRRRTLRVRRRVDGLGVRPPLGREVRRAVGLGDVPFATAVPSSGSSVPHTTGGELDCRRPDELAWLGHRPVPRPGAVRVPPGRDREFRHHTVARHRTGRRPVVSRRECGSGGYDGRSGAARHDENGGEFLPLDQWALHRTSNLDSSG